jgi:hypothetical protein
VGSVGAEVMEEQSPCLNADHTSKDRSTVWQDRNRFPTCLIGGLERVTKSGGSRAPAL